jgi:superfamily I DNA/RNA helicase
MNRTCKREPPSLPILRGPDEAIWLTRCSQDTASTVDCPAYLRDLNFAQRAAVQYGDLDAAGAGFFGPLLVIAGAGTGKTDSLAHRVAHLILTGTPPDRILLLTFSRRAAAEMTRRAQRILAAARAASKPKTLGPNGEIAWSGTFHAIGNRLLREHADSMDSIPPSPFSIVPIRRTGSTWFATIRAWRRRRRASHANKRALPSIRTR